MVRTEVLRLPIFLHLFIAAVLCMDGGMSASARETRVTVAPARMSPIKHQIHLVGTVVAPRAAQISTDIGGLVAEVAVDIGDRVAQGDTLLTLDSRLEELSLQQANAAKREAQARLGEAERLLKMAEQLVERGTISESTLKSRQAEARIAKATADRLWAEEAQRRERVRRHTITAPFPGVIAQKLTEAGEWVAPGAALVALVETSHLRIDVAVPQEYFNSLHQDLVANLEFDAIPDLQFPARVVSTVPVSDPTMRTFVLRLEPVADDMRLAPGMSARATLILTTAERGVVIPRDAVKRYSDGRTTVWVAETSGDGKKASERQVVLGESFEGRVHVLEGVEAGAAVIVRGNELLQPDQKVRTAEGKD